MNACTDGNPERNENADQADQAKGNATGSEANLEHSRYERVDSKKLVRNKSAGSHTQRQWERHTRMIRETPTSPICSTMPCAVQ